MAAGYWRTWWAALVLAGAISTSGCAFVIVGGNVNSADGVHKAMGGWSDHDEDEDDDEEDEGGERAFFVVPMKLPSGQPSDAQRAALEAWLVDRAGGFTRFGAVKGAWKAGDGQIVAEDNVAYLVSMDDEDEGFAKELRQRIEEDFDQEEAYVQQW